MNCRRRRSLRRRTHGGRRRAVRGLRPVPVPGLGPKNQVRWQFGVLAPRLVGPTPTVGALVDAHRGARRPGATPPVGAHPVPPGAASHRRVPPDGASSRTPKARRRRATACRGTRPSSTRSTSSRSPLLPLAGAARDLTFAVDWPARTSRLDRATAPSSAAPSTRGDRGRVDRVRADVGRGRRARWCKVRRHGREHDTAGRAWRVRATRPCASRWSPCTRCWPSTTARSCRCSTHRSSPPRRWPAARTTARSRCSSATSAPTWCCRRRSSCTTTRRSRPRARATCSTPPRSTRSSRCACSRSPTRRRPRRAAPTPGRRPSSTGATTCRPSVGPAARRGPVAAPGGASRGAPTSRCRGGTLAVDESFDPCTDTLVIAGRRGQGRAPPCGSSRPVAPTPTTCSSSAWTPPSAGVFNDVDGDEHVAVTLDDDPATEELVWQGRYLYFHPDEVEPLRRAEAGR